ncbi:MAG TPA: calcium-binding protein [Rhizobiaceae bacterium]|nr:calcium-binding protein [Rhizobiaceae bacterium]
MATENPVTGEYTYGDGVTETRNVNGGATETIGASNTDAEPVLTIGRNAGGIGTVNIDGANSELFVDANGSNLVGTGLRIGLDGGTGTMMITNGGGFLLEDATGSYTEDEGNEIFTDEFAHIGRNGGTGTLEVDGVGSSFKMRGNAVGMQIGRNGGTGTVNVMAGATFELEENGVGGDGMGAGFQVGRGLDARGTFNIDGGTATIDASAGGPAGFQVGRDFGVGVINIENSGDLILNGDGGHNVQIGLGFGQGTVNVAGAGSTVLLSGNDGFTNVRIGGSGGIGELNVTNGATFTVDDTNGQNDLSVGIDADSMGKLVVAGGGSTLTFESDGDNNSFATIGRDGGEGMVVVREGGTLTLTSEDFADFEIGNGGSGIVEVGSNSTLTVESTDADNDDNSGANIYVGQNGGTGQLLIRGGAVNIASTTYVNLLIGTSWNHSTAEAGTGFVLLDDGAQLTFTSGVNPDGGASMDIGGNGDSYGEVVVRDGSSINMGGEGFMTIGGHGTGEGRLEIIGDGSTVTGVNGIQVGYDPNGFNTQPGGTGNLVVTRGGQLNVGFLSVATGGTLSGLNGTVVGDMALTSGGTLDLLDGRIGRFTVDGNININSGGNKLRLDINATATDALDVSNGINIDDGLVLTLNAIDSFTFGAGVTRTIFTADFVSNDPGKYGAIVLGQNAQFAYIVGNYGVNPNEITIETLNSGSTGGTATLNFGAGVGVLTYNSATDSGTVSGGRFGAAGATVYKIDVVNGTSANDTFTVTGSTARVLKFNGLGGNDKITGGAGVDTILGGIGNDTILGNNGNDILQGDGGKDTMTGGVGNDTFKFMLKTDSVASHANADVIMDFDDPGKGNDKIDLAGIYGPKLAFIGAAAFTKVGQVRVNDIAGADVIVEVNLSGSLAADFAIRLKATTLAQVGLDDFVL